MANVKLTKQSSEGEIKAYFTNVLELVKMNEEFPVNLDDVWPLVFSRKDAALRALADDELFMQDVDYQVFHQNVENLKEEKPKGGRPTDTYMLSVACMEFFIARRVRPVFEVYRKIFHKTMSEAQAKVGQTTKRQQLVESLTEMGVFFGALTFNCTVDEWCEPVISARRYFNYVYTGKMKGRDFDKWMYDRYVYGPVRYRLDCVKMKRPTEWDPKPAGQDYALSLAGLAKLAEYEMHLFEHRDEELSGRARTIFNLYDDCMVRLDQQQDEPYTLSDVVVEMRRCIYGAEADRLRVPRSSRLFDGEYAPSPCAPALMPRHDYAPEMHHKAVTDEVGDKLASCAEGDAQAWAVYEVVDDRPQAVDLASPSLTTEGVCRAMKSFEHAVTARFDAAAGREQDTGARKSILQVRDDFKTNLSNTRTNLCNLVYIEEALRHDYPDTAAADGANDGKEATR